MHIGGDERTVGSQGRADLRPAGSEDVDAGRGTADGASALRVPIQLRDGRIHHRQHLRRQAI